MGVRSCPVGDRPTDTELGSDAVRSAFAIETVDGSTRYDRTYRCDDDGLMHAHAPIGGRSNFRRGAQLPAHAVGPGRHTRPGAACRMSGTVVRQERRIAQQSWTHDRGAEPGQVVVQPQMLWTLPM